MIFLGHVLLANGISAKPKKVDKVRDWLVPKNAKELHSFLGLASYYCQFISNFAHVAKCLHQLISSTNVKISRGKKKEVTTLGPPEQTKPIFIWMSGHQVAFDALMTALTTTPVLQYPDFTKEFILEWMPH